MRDSLGTDHDSPRTASGIVAATVLFAIAKGVPPRRIRAATGLTVDDLLHAEGWFPQSALPAVWRLIAEASPGEPVALEMASVVPAETLGPLASMTQVTPTLRAYFELLIEHHRVASEEMRAWLEARGDETAFCMSHPMDAQDGGLTAELVFAVGARTLRPRGADEVGLSRVEFTHAPNGPTQAYADFFGAPVLFAQPVNALVFPSDRMDAPRQPHQPVLQAFLKGNLARLQERLGRARADLELDAVREAIADNAAAGEWGAEALARRMGMSLRSLQRRVRAQDTSAQELIDEAREAEARRLLADPTLSTEEVAERLGYSSPRALRRACKRWTGRTPGELRRGGG